MRRIRSLFFLTLAAVVTAAALTSCHHRHAGDSLSDPSCQTCGHSEMGEVGATPVYVEPAPQPSGPVQPAPHAVNPPVVKHDEAKPPVETKPPVAKTVETGPFKAVRIKAGTRSTWKDKDGNVWLADAGFDKGSMEGDMVAFENLKIENTANPGIYTSERNGMDKFVWTVPNGQYTVKLHFAENDKDVKSAGERVFSVDVQGEKIEKLDIFKDAGGANKALVKTVKVTVTNGKLEINFKAEKKEALIDGIEILPE